MTQIIASPTNFQIVEITKIKDKKVHFEMINDRVNPKYKGTKGYWTIGNVINDAATLKWFASNPTGVWLAWTYQAWNGKRPYYTLMAAPISLKDYSELEQRKLWLHICKPFNEIASAERDKRTMSTRDIFIFGKPSWDNCVATVKGYFDRVEKAKLINKLVNEILEI